jgi:hypothetical protein
VDDKYLGGTIARSRAGVLFAADFFRSSAETLAPQRLWDEVSSFASRTFPHSPQLLLSIRARRHDGRRLTLRLMGPDAVDAGMIAPRDRFEVISVTTDPSPSWNQWTDSLPNSDVVGLRRLNRAGKEAGDRKIQSEPIVRLPSSIQLSPALFEGSSSIEDAKMMLWKVVADFTRETPLSHRVGLELFPVDLNAEDARFLLPRPGEPADPWNPKPRAKADLNLGDDFEILGAFAIDRGIEIQAYLTNRR